MKTIITKIKRLFTNTLNNQRGVVLPIILMAIGGLSLIGAAAIGVSTGEIGIANNDRNYKSAFNIAEAGIADATDGIQADRDLLPRPLGAVNSSTYSFNVGMGNSGRYIVNVWLPVVANLTSPVAQNASSVVIDNTANLNPGDTVIIGDTATHIMTKIGSITGNTLNLVDSRNQPYTFMQSLNSGYVAKNKLMVQSVGQAGLGLTGQYSTVGGWRNLSNINSVTPTVASGGAMRSTVTLQGEYSIQEIDLFNSLTANASPQGPRKFYGPILVTGSLDINPYNKGDYTGPIFAPVNIITGNNIQFNNAAYNPINNPINANYPKVVGISTSAASRINMTNILNTAASNAKCYQVECTNASASQQIYYLNGYQIDVVAYKPNGNGTPGFPITLNSDALLDPGGTTVTFSFTVTSTFSTTSTDNLTLNLGTATGTSNGQGTTFNPQNVVAVNPDGTPNNNITLNTQGQTSNIQFTLNQTYLQGTVVTVTVNVADLPAAGAYLRVWDNSANAGGIMAGSGYSNGVWITKFGNIESQGYQGDTNVYADGGTHPNHTTVLTTAPTIYARGTYTPDGDTVATSSTWQTGYPVLFGGALSNSTTTFGSTSDGGTNITTTLKPAMYYTTYFIHTTALGNCNEHDITITSLTKVTYLGTSRKCTNDSETRRMYLVETIWNHTSQNLLNQGLQADDSDPKLGVIAHKGYYKWIKTGDPTDPNPIRAELLFGDKEFLSVFNHSAKPDYHSAIINANIGKKGDGKSGINIIGAANPPTMYDSAGATMTASPSAFTGWTLPAGTSGAGVTNRTNWDWADMVGARSAFPLNGGANDMDFSGFTIANQNVMPYTQSNGDKVLPDVSVAWSYTGGFKQYKATTSNPEIKSTNYNNTATTPTGWTNISDTGAPTGQDPLMNVAQLPTTVITATISGPNFTAVTVKRGYANLLFDAANGIPFNVDSLSISTRGAGANITIGTSANPATVFADTISIKSDSCAGANVNFNLTGKVVSNTVTLGGGDNNNGSNFTYTIDTSVSTANTCINPDIQGFIYLKKEGWREIR